MAGGLSGGASWRRIGGGAGIGLVVLFIVMMVLGFDRPAFDDPAENRSSTFQPATRVGYEAEVVRDLSLGVDVMYQKTKKLRISRFDRRKLPLGLQGIHPYERFTCSHHHLPPNSRLR